MSMYPNRLFRVSGVLRRRRGRSVKLTPFCCGVVVSDGGRIVEIAPLLKTFLHQQFIKLVAWDQVEQVKFIKYEDASLVP